MFRARLLIPVLTMAIVVAACGGGTATTTLTDVAPSTSATESINDVGAFPMVIAAANGSVELPARPQAIVSLSATHTEMLFAIGAGDQVVAVDVFSNYPPEAPTTDLNALALNVESILVHEPDLVIIDGDWDGTTVGTLTDLGVPVIVLPPAVDLDDAYSQIVTLGEATGHSEEAETLVGAMRAEIDEITAALPVDAERRTFYHELDTTLYSITSDTFIGRVYGILGLENIADAAGEGTSGYPQLSGEYILQQDPDFIFLADTVCCGASAESVAARPGWDVLAAVRNGNVVELHDDTASRWGPRIVDFVRTIAEALGAVGE